MNTKEALDFGSDKEVYMAMFVTADGKIIVKHAGTEAFDAIEVTVTPGPRGEVVIKTVRKDAEFDQESMTKNGVMSETARIETTVLMPEILSKLADEDRKRNTPATKIDPEAAKAVAEMAKANGVDVMPVMTAGNFAGN